MAPSTLDLMILTFNCAKNLIDVDVFAHHLKDALGRNGPDDGHLPDIVVFSLQEIAPLGYSFVGGYFLNAYLSRFQDALNLAAVRYHDGATPSSSSSTSPKPDSDGNDESGDGQREHHRQPYKLVTARNVGYTAIVMLARDASRVQDLQEAEVRFGTADMGNKGAVGLRCLYNQGGSGAGSGTGSGTGAGDGDGDGAQTELTFVATHLAAMEWNLARRNADWAAIMRALTFADPEAAVARQQKKPQKQRKQQERQQERRQTETCGLLRNVDADADDDDDDDDDDAAHRRELHSLSIFKPSSHLFVAGDLNYRISTTPPPPGAPFPDEDPASDKHYMRFRHLDQLTRERDAGRTLHGMSEADVSFPPTYKYKVTGRPASDAAAAAHRRRELTWHFAPHRYPAWTDRILYLDTPGSGHGGGSGGSSSGGGGGSVPPIVTRAYEALPVMETSDHRAVFWRADVPLIGPGRMRALVAGSAESKGQTVPDPRSRLPVEIDPAAWGRRTAARGKELVVGWAALLSSTWEGGLAWTSVAALTVAWWYWLSMTAEPQQL